MAQTATARPKPGDTLTCGHVLAEQPRGSITTGYGTNPSGDTVCYPCADAEQVANLRTERTVVGYLSSDGKRVTTWTGGTLMRVTTVADSPGNHRRYVYATDVHGKAWRGSGPRDTGDYVTMHRA